MDKNSFEKSNFISGVRDELKKVTWPTRPEAIRLTIAVFIISLIVGVYVGIIDVGLTKALELLTKLR